MVVVKINDKGANRLGVQLGKLGRDSSSGKICLICFLLGQRLYRWQWVHTGLSGSESRGCTQGLAEVRAVGAHTAQ